MLAHWFNAYRLAAYCLILFALGHTLGTVVRTPSFGPESDAVMASMKSVRFSAQGANVSWYGMFRGMSASVTLFMVFEIVVAWYLGGQSLEARRALAPISWTLFLVSVAGAANAWLFFFPVATGFSLVVAILIGAGCVNDILAR